jgi:hypothetical protein
MEKKELVAMLMDSPFYFDILLGERLVILQQHSRRFLGKTRLDRSIDAKKVADSIMFDERDIGKVTTIIVGYIPPQNQAKAEPSPAPTRRKPSCPAPRSGMLLPVS